MQGKPRTKFAGSRANQLLAVRRGDRLLIHLPLIGRGVSADYPGIDVGRGFVAAQSEAGRRGRLEHHRPRARVFDLDPLPQNRRVRKANT